MTQDLDVLDQRVLLGGALRTPRNNTWARMTGLRPGGSACCWRRRRRWPLAAPRPGRRHGQPAPSLALCVGSSPRTAWPPGDGGSAEYNNFWQLFARRGGFTHGALVAPPGMASNGASCRPVYHGGLPRPSQNITYSPLTSTADDGARLGHRAAAGGAGPFPMRCTAGPASAASSGWSGGPSSCPGQAALRGRAGDPGGSPGGRPARR